MVLAPLSAGFQSLPPLSIITLGRSGAASQVGGFEYNSLQKLDPKILVIFGSVAS